MDGHRDFSGLYRICTRNFGEIFIRGTTIVKLMIQLRASQAQTVLLLSATAIFLVAGAASATDYYVSASASSGGSGKLHNRCAVRMIDAHDEVTVARQVLALRRVVAASVTVAV